MISKETIDKVFEGDSEYRFFEKEKLNINSRLSLSKHQYIPLQELNNEKSLRIIRAFTWPKVLAPAYTLINNQKVNLVYVNDKN